MIIAIFKAVSYCGILIDLSSTMKIIKSDQLNLSGLIIGSRII